MSKRARQMKLGPCLDLLVQRAVALLQFNAPKDGSPYYGCFSGGKDSVVIKELARMAGVPIEWHYNVIIDPPELMRFIKREHPDVSWEFAKFGRGPRKGQRRPHFFRRIKEKLLVPTRFCRWCCTEYKHSKGPKGCTRVLGIRIEESGKRANNYTACVMPKAAGRREVYPIRLWTQDNVWTFIRQQKIAYCSLYDEGFERLGCVGCPLSTPAHRKAEFARWPHFEKQWRNAFDLVVSERERLGKSPPPAIFSPSGEPMEFCSRRRIVRVVGE